MKCTQCNNPELIQNIRVLDQIGDSGKSDLAIETQTTPHALFITDTVSIPLTASVCGKCGNVMFSINDAQHLALLNKTADDFDENAPADDKDLESPLGFGSFLEDERSREEDEDQKDTEKED